MEELIIAASDLFHFSPPFLKGVSAPAPGANLDVLTQRR
jgi:hypothetical protein